MKNILYFVIFVVLISNVFQLFSSDKINEKCNNFEVNTDKYRCYENKIWEIKDKNIKKIYICPTFIITNTSLNKFSIKIQMKREPYPICYINTFEKKDNYVDMNCKIVNNKINCSFVDYDGNKFNFILSLKENGTIVGDIKTELKNNNSENIPNGSYVFSPKTISDYNSLENVKTIPTYLNFWGKVNITTGYYMCSHPYAMAYITNNNGDIFYRFDGMTNGVKILNVVVKDVNNDGLNDIKIVMDTSQIEKIEYIYIQMKNGMFYDSKLDPNPNISNLAPLP